MLPPLAHHCKGYLQTGNKNLLLSAGCNIKTAWCRVDKIFEQCMPALMAMIKSQLTVTCMFNNWQRLINKLWQCIPMLPAGTIMISPLGLKFHVISCIAIDVYTFIVIGKLVPFPINLLDRENYDDILSEIRIINTEVSCGRGLDTRSMNSHELINVTHLNTV